MNSTVLTSVIILLGAMIVGCSANPNDLSVYRPARIEVEGMEKKIGNSPIRGYALAPVTVMVFSDFQCGHCRDASRTLYQLQERYPQHVKLVFKNLPLGFHSKAKGAAIAAAAADRQGRFWSMHDLIFDSQPYMSSELYLQFARRLDLDLDQFRKDLRDPDLKRAIMRDMGLAASWSISGTPGIVINGEIFRGYQSLDTLTAAVERHLREHFEEKIYRHQREIAR